MINKLLPTYSQSFFLLHYTQLFSKLSLQYFTTSLIINRTYGATQLIHTHSQTRTHGQVYIAKSHWPIWAWHDLSYSNTSSIYIVHFLLNISKLLFFVQIYFSVSYFNLTFPVLVQDDRLFYARAVYAHKQNCVFDARVWSFPSHFGFVHVMFSTNACSERKKDRGALINYNVYRWKMVVSGGWL